MSTPSLEQVQGLQSNKQFLKNAFSNSVFQATSHTAYSGSQRNTVYTEHGIRRVAQRLVATWKIRINMFR